jgi:hypothetical protein
MSIDEIEQAIAALSPTDRAKFHARALSADNIVAEINSLPLKERIYVLKTGIANLSPEGRATVLSHFRPGAVVCIYDQEGENLSLPCAMVIYDDRCEHINIIASVKQNADSIRHPAISLAIRRWSSCIAAQFALARDKDRAGGAGWELAKGNFFKKAQGHIRNIGKALRDASQSQQKLEAASAFAWIIQRIDENIEPYLRVCWKVLKIHKNEITTGENEEGDKYERNDREKCRVLKSRVLEYFRIHSFGDWPPDTPVDENVVRTLEPYFDIVLEFFGSPEGAVFFNSPNKFNVMLNAYAQRATGLSAGTISDYRGRMKKGKLPKAADYRFLEPEISETVGRSYDPVSGKVVLFPATQGTNYYHTEELDNSFDLPMVSCSLPKCQHYEHPRYKQ